MNKIIILLLSLFYLSAACSEPALYKEIKLTAADQLLVMGNVEITLIQSDALKAEVFLRDSSTSELRIGTEKSDKGARLVIKEQSPSQGSQIEPKSIAKVNVYLPDIKKIDLQNIASFQISGFDQDKLKVWASGNALVSFTHSDIDTLQLHLTDKANFSGENLKLKHLKIRQYQHTYTSIKNSRVDNLVTENHNSSHFSIDNTRGGFLKLSVRDSAQINSSGDNQFIAATLTARSDTLLNVSTVTFKTIKLTARNSAIVNLGKAESVDITAKNSAVITHFPAKHIEIEKRNSVKIEQYVTGMEANYE